MGKSTCAVGGFVTSASAYVGGGWLILRHFGTNLVNK